MFEQLFELKINFNAGSDDNIAHCHILVC
jgi:hypothetical protein